MKYLKHLLLLSLLLFCAVPMNAQDEKPQVDVKSILWGHIKDSYRDSFARHREDFKRLVLRLFQ